MKSSRQTDKKDPQVQSFRLFLIGGMLLLGSLGAILAANVYLPPSLKQEAIVFGGLVFAAIGGVIALFSYIKMLVLRIKYFLEKE